MFDFDRPARDNRAVALHLADKQHTLDEGEKQVRRFKAEAKERLTRAAAALKNVLAQPSTDLLTDGVAAARMAIVTTADDAGMIDGWYEGRSRAGVDMQSAAFQSLKHDFLNWRGADNAHDQEGIKAAASDLGKLIKRGIETLAAVKHPS